MNIGKTFSHHPGTIPLFTWLWLFGSIVAASYFAFRVFPAIVDPAAQIYFQTKVGNETTSWPNPKSFRAQYLGNISDTSNLYYTGCSTVALSEVQNCDPKYNWFKLDPKSLNCTNVSTCSKDTYFVPKDVQATVLQFLTSMNGHPPRAKDPNTVSFSDPAGWGGAGKWPIFFVTLFLALKLGRAVGEFAVTEYAEG
jgi:hypothetical protein